MKDLAIPGNSCEGTIYISISFAGETLKILKAQDANHYLDGVTQ